MAPINYHSMVMIIAVRWIKKTELVRIPVMFALIKSRKMENYLKIFQEFKNQASMPGQFMIYSDLESGKLRALQ